MTGANRLAALSVNILKFLGQGLPKLSVITSSILAAISFFYVFTLASYLQVTVYIFIRRVSYINPFDDYLISKYYDGAIISSFTFVWLAIFLTGKKTKLVVSGVYGTLLVIGLLLNVPTLIDFTALTSLPIILFFLFYYGTTGAKGKKNVQKILSLTRKYFVLISIALGIITIAFSLSLILLSKPIPIHNYGYDIFLFFSSFSPILLILIFFGSPIKLLAEGINIRRGVKQKRKSLAQQESVVSEGKPQKIRARKNRLLYLLAFVIFSICLALIPHLPSINKDNQMIGVDSHWYVEWTTPLRDSETLQEFLKAAFIDQVRGDRPLSLISLFLLATFIKAAPFYIFEYLPVILGPALVLVVYFLTRELTSNDTTSLYAAFITGIGYFQGSIGIYAGFYANWIALIIGYSSLIFFFRFLKTASKVSLPVFFILLLTTLFSHAHTWTFLVIVTGIFLGVSFMFKFYPRQRIILLLLVIVLSLTIDVAKTMMVESTGSAGGVKLGIEVAEAYVRQKGADLIWNTLVDAIQHHYGGTFANFIILGLVLYWLIRSNLRINYNVFLTIFLVIGIPVLFYGDWVVQSRVYYNIPFQIPAAIALTYISRQLHSRAILLPIYVWLIAMSIRTVSNFYEVLPS